MVKAAGVDEEALGRGSVSDLVDELSVRLAISGDELERVVRRMEIEELALKKETDAASQDRLSKRRRDPASSTRSIALSGRKRPSCRTATSPTASCLKWTS